MHNDSPELSLCLVTGPAFPVSLGDGYSREYQAIALRINGLVQFAELLHVVQSNDFVFLQELVFYFRPVTGT